MLAVQQLAYAPSFYPLFHSIHFCLNPGQTLFLQGMNGSGKTSLMRLISGLIPCEQGQIIWYGKRIQCAADYQGQLAYLGHQTGCFIQLSLWENLCWHYRLMSSAWNSKKKDDIKNHLNAALDFAGLGAKKELSFYRLSAGQKQRLHLARLWLSLHEHKHALWLLDEPLAHIDQQAKALYFDLFKKFQQQQGILIIASHQNQQEIDADYCVALS